MQDWAKLRHLIEYLRNTVKLPLTLGATSGGVMHWYVDAAFAVHPNMRGHRNRLPNLVLQQTEIEHVKLDRKQTSESR